MSNDNKVKGLLKGLRFISQIFDNNEKGKEPEIQIGNPTDVRHVAHVGWDGHGPSENPPSWMNEFKSVPGNSPAPPNPNGDINCKGQDNSVKQVSSDSARNGSRSVNCQGQERDSSELPKSSKKHSNSTAHMRESHAKERSDRPRQTKKSSKNSHSNDSFHGSKHNDGSTDSLQLQGSDLPPKSTSDSPKKPRSKKSKDGSTGGSSKSRSKGSHRESKSNEGSSSKSRNRQRRSCGEDGQLERGSNPDILINYSN